jgi:hypothetical protein
MSRGWHPTRRPALVFGAPVALPDHDTVKCRPTALTVCTQVKIAFEPSFGYSPLTLSKRAVCTQIKRSSALHEP